MPANISGQRHLARDFVCSVWGNSTPSGSIATPPTYVTAAGFAIAVWVRPVAFSAAQSLLTNAATTGAPQFRITTVAALEILPYTSGSSLTGGLLRKGLWSRALVSCNLTTGVTTLYQDGEEVAAVSGTIGGVAFAQPAGAITMALQGGTLLSNLCIYNRPLTAAEARADCYSAGPTPVARYPMNEGVGTSTADDFGGASMTLTGCLWSPDVPTQPIKLGQDWGSILQAGASYLTLPSSGSDNLGLSLAGLGSFSVSMWVKLLSAPASIDLLRINTTGTVGLRLQLDGGTNFIATVRAGLDGAVSTRATNVTVPLALGQWVHYSARALISDGASGRIALFRNGIPMVDAAADFTGQTSIAWNTANTGTVGFIGGGTSGANPVPGLIGPVRMGPALTRAQLRKLVFEGVTGIGEPWLKYQHTAGAGTVSANTGTRAGCNATLTGAAAWSLDAPW